MQYSIGTIQVSRWILGMELPDCPVGIDISQNYLSINPYLHGEF